ncbi:FtsK/SpoIIIE domain-containing protein [Actinoalloteichus caeruleus]|uniref:FtsK/SpoIIIE domain-containing protein n=1 Tax=Actinoalloteichus cyanogriseus TaxID=2893586 RepID=UPI003AB05470
MPEPRRWVDPAPLEIARPRLPWWLLLPKTVLLVGFPVLALVALTAVGVGVLRRACRYPVAALVLLLVLLAAVGSGWPVALLTAALLAVVCGAWRWKAPVSFRRVLLVELRSEWRRATVYAPAWHRVMRFADLGRRVDRKTYLPRLLRVRSHGWRDRLTVALLAGQTPAEFEARSDALAHSFGARSCRVRVLRPRRIMLDLVHADPLAAPVAPPPLPDPTAVVDLRSLPLGVTDTGRSWTLPLHGTHWLVVGATGAGKASVVWALLRAVAPLVRKDQVRVYGIDPKGGMELGRAPAVFHRLVCQKGQPAVELLEHLAEEVRTRAESMRGHARNWSPEHGPFLILVVDELADLVAYETDRKLRERANAALQLLTSQGRAPGVAVVGQVQDPRKEIIGFRHLFPTRIALRLDEPTQVDMVLGDALRQRGAAAHDIPDTTPGVAWVGIDGRRDPQRVRAFHTTDAELTALTDYLTSASDTPADGSEDAEVITFPTRDHRDQRGEAA